MKTPAKDLKPEQIDIASLSKYNIDELLIIFKKLKPGQEFEDGKYFKQGFYQDSMMRYLLEQFFDDIDHYKIEGITVDKKAKQIKTCSSPRMDKLIKKSPDNKGKKLQEKWMPRF